MRPAPSFCIFQGRQSGRRALSFRLSRDVCDGMSNRKLATAALNLLGPRRGGARAVGGVSPRGASRGRRSSSFHAASGRSSSGRATALMGLRRLVTVLGLVKVATRPGSLRASLAGARRTPSRLGARPGPPGGARQGGGRLPDEAAQSAGSEPFEVRVPPEGCPVAGRPGAGAVRLPRQAPKKSGYSLALVRGNNDILNFWRLAHGARVIFSSCGNADAHRGT